MKKYIFTLALFLICSFCHAQNVNAIFNQFENEPNAEIINISPFMMSLGKMFAQGEDLEIASNIKSMRVLEIDKCNAATRERFNKSIEKLDSHGYETLIRVNDSGEKVRIFTKIKKGYICEMAIACVEKNECTLVLMNGKIKKQDIDKLVAEQTNKKDGRR